MNSNHLKPRMSLREDEKHCSASPWARTAMKLDSVYEAAAAAAAVVPLSNLTLLVSLRASWKTSPGGVCCTGGGYGSDFKGVEALRSDVYSENSAGKCRPHPSRVWVENCHCPHSLIHPPAPAAAAAAADELHPSADGSSSAGGGASRQSLEQPIYMVRTEREYVDLAKLSYPRRISLSDPFRRGDGVRSAFHSIWSGRLISVQTSANENILRCHSIGWERKLRSFQGWRHLSRGGEEGI